MDKLKAWWAAKDKKARKNLMLVGLFGTIILFAILSSVFGGK